MTNKSLLTIFLVPTCIVMIPAIAMLLNADGWAWRLADFIVAWVVIAGAITGYKLVASKATDRAYRTATRIAVATGVVLLWINGAVGLIGSEDNPANLMYAGVLLIGVVGAAIARLEALGMARALFATAFAQFMVPIVALIVWRPDFSPGVVKVLALNFVFVLLFAAAAVLYRRAAGNSRGTETQVRA